MRISEIVSRIFGRGSPRDDENAADAEELEILRTSHRESTKRVTRLEKELRMVEADIRAARR